MFPPPISSDLEVGEKSNPAENTGTKTLERSPGRKLQEILQRIRPESEDLVRIQQDLNILEKQLNNKVNFQEHIQKSGVTTRVWIS